MDEILRYAQNDIMGRARNDRKELLSKQAPTLPEPVHLTEAAFSW
ncbi:MAG: hypothetical protein NTW48_11130 [Chloroflexi bacterium]|nr:hypothetical protein [Chloroflexota bacterium]